MPEMRPGAADREAIDRIVRLLSPRSRVLFITGAGMSAESGLPTYRGIGGLYSRSDPEEGVPIEEALSGRMLLERPGLCWKYLAEVGRAATGSTFNRGHRVIAEMEDHFARVCVLTQNIDGYHHAAGSRNVIDIHGSVHNLLCMGCPFQESVQSLEAVEIPPRCPRCGAVLRPDVVLFGEALPPEKLRRLREEIDLGFDVVFSVGTSSVFPYIVLPIQIAGRLGWATVEINPDDTRISDLVDYRLTCGAACALDALWAAYLGREEA